jgi:hypothetical protein
MRSFGSIAAERINDECHICGCCQDPIPLTPIAGVLDNPIFKAYQVVESAMGNIGNPPIPSRGNSMYQYQLSGDIPQQDGEDPYPTYDFACGSRHGAPSFPG